MDTMPVVQHFLVIVKLSLVDASVVLHMAIPSYSLDKLPH